MKTSFKRNVKFIAIPTTSVGLDALSHAMEVVIGVKQNAFSTPLAFDYIERIRKWLPIVYKNPENKEGRAQLSYAAHMAESTSLLLLLHAVVSGVFMEYQSIDSGVNYNDFINDRCQFENTRPEGSTRCIQSMVL